MPVNPTYPGVYVQEIPSGVRTIVGVATSITAFIGSAPRGPIDGPVTITNYADFERNFGGLDVHHPMSYAVQDFYLNGGSQAVIVRLFNDKKDDGTKISAVWKQTKAGLHVQAASPGAWGNHVTLTIDNDVAADAPANAFNLLVQEKVNEQPVRTEQFRTLTVTDGPRRIDKVLKAQSQLLRWDDDSSNALPSPTIAKAFSDALALVVTAQANLKAAQDAKPQVPADITAAQAALNNAVNTFNTPSGHTAADVLLLPLKATTFLQDRANKAGVFQLEKVDLFNLLCIPPYQNLDNDGGDIEVSSLLSPLAQYCQERRALLLIDAPSDWTSPATAIAGLPNIISAIGGSSLAKNVALHFPRILKSDILNGGRIKTFTASGAVAGIFARTDTQRGVWKAPAGLEASIAGIAGVSVPLTDGENGLLNPLAVNCLRTFPASGTVVWGARTLQGNDQLASEWKYIPVRRTALYIEESLYRGLQWVVFEPNDEPLWAQIRLNVGAFMHNLFVKGAFQGQTPRDAYFVKCDKETTTQNDIDLGIVNIVVGFAPLKPAEFVIISLQQIAGQIQV
jgi:phage tail sheath protein FI